MGFLALLLWVGCSKQEEPQRVRLWALAPPEVTLPDGDGPPPVRFAVALMISPQEGYQLYGDLAEALGKEIGRPVQLILRRTFSEVNDLVRSRQAEIAQLCGRGFLQGRTDFGLRALAVPLIKGSKSHSSYVIVSAESEIGSSAELEGKSFAFADPLCAPVPLTAEFGAWRSKAFFKRKLTVASHDGAIRAVAERQVDGALVDGLVYAWLKSADPRRIEKTKIIMETAPYLNPPVAAHPGIDPALRKTLSKAFLNLHEREAGRTALSGLGIERFAAPPDEVSR